MSWFMGIDLGSAYSKGVLVKDFEIVVSHVIRSGSDYRASADALRIELTGRAGLTPEDVLCVVATGSGADVVSFAEQKASDIVCTARGIHSIFPQVRTVVDLGSLSTRAIRLDEEGTVTNFTVSEKCAAGGGRFIEVIASILRVDLIDFGPLAAKSKNPVEFGTGCAVFGESEAITRVSEGVPIEDIAAGVNRALAGKISSLVRKIRLEEPCAICGGGAHNTALVQTVQRELNIELLVPPAPQIATCLGAAITARTRATGETGRANGLEA
ncbi:MAG: acyl-CoA dehydratase activase [Dehalococcoidia bacterium]